MKLIEEITLANGLKLNVFDLSRAIAADTVKVEICIRSQIDLRESYFRNPRDFDQMKKKFGAGFPYIYRMKRSFVAAKNHDLVREELLAAFKKNSLCYLSTADFPQKAALAALRDLQKNLHKYQASPEKKYD